MSTETEKSKTEKRKCKFSDHHKTKYLCFEAGRNETEAKCMVFDSYVSVANKGMLDLQRHIESERHRKMVRTYDSNAKMTFFVPKHSTADKKAHAAEATLAFHTVAHHQSYRSMDCTAGLMHKLFADSDTAKNISCGRTKSEAIINCIIGPHSVTKLVQTLNDIRYFGVATDASNHGAEKLFPVIVQYFDWKSGGTKTGLDSMPNETSETISKYLVDTLKKYHLSSKCIAFSGDNANVNFGGISRRDALQCPLVGVGCPAHVLHNCIQHGADLLPVGVETIVLKMFNYFSIYTICTQALKDFCDFIDVTYQQLLYSKNRWLSLFPAIERLLHIFPALKAYFQSIDQPPVLLKIFFENNFSELYLWFIHSLMSVFQCQIALIEKEEMSLLDETFIPLTVRQLLTKLHQDGRDANCKFTQAAKSIYQACISYLEKWKAPFAEFQCFQWMFLDRMKDISFHALLPCVQYLKEKGIDLDNASLFDQYRNVKSFAEQQKHAEFFKRPLSQQWRSYFKDTVACPSELLTVCTFFFAIPGNNANVERVFSRTHLVTLQVRNIP
uniref:HAT C-terminal dimerisation domain-containing protein n=1 Tax=Erpetoichthys calabaricus TaxID=27687 RepID=A0A8C4S9U8_ERPCA